MDARNPLHSDIADQDEVRPRRLGGSPALRIGFVLLLVTGGVIAVAVWPETARDWAGQAIALVTRGFGAHPESSAPAQATPIVGVERAFHPTKEQLASFGVESIRSVSFRPEGSAEGRIALNEDENVPVYSPYAGRVIKIAARAGDEVKLGQILFTIEVTDMVQAQNDYQSAINALAKVQELLKLNKTIAARQQELFQAKAAALKDYQSAQNDVISSQSDMQTAEAALQAVKNRLRILGKTDAEITAFEKSGKMSPNTDIRAPIAGTVVQRKLGLGQYLAAGSDPVFTIGNLSPVWLIANVRESEIPKIRIGQAVEARVNGFGDRIFKARISYVAASLDPATRRLAIRCEVENPDRELKPEMFARFEIITGDAQVGPAIPDNAVVYEGERAHVWVMRTDGAIEAREIKLGLRNGSFIQVTHGLQTGEQVVSRGALFIDRAAGGDKAS